MLRIDLIRAEFMRKLDGTGKVESGVPVKGECSYADERGPSPGSRLQK